MVSPWVLATECEKVRPIAGSRHQTRSAAGCANYLEPEEQ
jgi:hypothetical protein